MAFGGWKYYEACLCLLRWYALFRVGGRERGRFLRYPAGGQHKFYLPTLSCHQQHLGRLERSNFGSRIGDGWGCLTLYSRSRLFDFVHRQLQITNKNNYL